MGILDNNRVFTRPLTGLENSGFTLLSSNDNFDVWGWDRKKTGKRLNVSFRDVFVWTSNTALYLVKGKITDTLTEVPVNDTNFPNLRKKDNEYPTISGVISCPCTFSYVDSQKYGHYRHIDGESVRLCVIFSNGQIYHNYPSCQNDCDFYNDVWATNSPAVKVEDLFTKFDESVIWDLPNRKNPTNDLDLVATGAYYYNPALSAKCYEMHPAINAANTFGNSVGFGATNSMNNSSSGSNIGLRARFFRTDIDDPVQNSFNYMGGYVADNLFTMIGTYSSNLGEHPTRTCVFGTQDGGRSWYNLYEFAGKNTVYTQEMNYQSDGTIGVPLAQSGSAGTGIYSIKKRIMNAPSAADKEPTTLFTYLDAKDVDSIVGTSEGIKFTTHSAHGYTKGDVIVVGFQDGVSASSRTFDWMVNETADGVSGGNGILFIVTNVTTDTFDVTLYPYNPDSNIPVRHIHAMNRCKDGVSVSCGEEYPHGGWILYDAIKEADAYAGYNVANPAQNNFVRLNSTSDSFQRPLGSIVQQEGLDTYCYIGSDNEFTPMNDVNMPTGRTETFKHNSCGVWKVKLEDIDNHKDYGQMKLNAVQTAFGFQQMATAFVYTGQFGALAVSYDNGETWTHIQLPSIYRGQELAHFSGMTYDRKFSINDILVQLKK